MPSSLTTYTHIRAVFFDLDGTLKHENPDANKVFFDHAVQLGVVDEPARRVKALRWAHAYWANTHKQVEQDFKELGDSAAFWQNYAARYLLAYGCSPAQAETLAPQMQAYMSENFKPEPVLLPDTHTTLTALREKGYTLGVITNRSKPCHDTIEALGLTGYFDLVLSAGEVQAYKPEPEIFGHALHRTGMPPQASLYVGDNYYADILGAARAGLHPVLLDPARVFPEVDCPVIDSLGGVYNLLNHAG